MAGVWRIAPIDLTDDIFAGLSRIGFALRIWRFGYYCNSCLTSFREGEHNNEMALRKTFWTNETRR